MRTILVVADDPEVADRIERYLETQGYQTSHARRGEDALARMGQERPELVLLDWDLPHMSGAEVCHAMQRDPRLMGIPVITLAASATPRERTLAYAAGVDDYLTKPFDLEELADHIGAQLSYCDLQPTSGLTGLPTGPAVVAAITTWLANPQPRSALIYVDIEHLDAYNETYSCIEGNELIQRTAAILQAALATSGSAGTFLGYVGDGEFILITAPGQAQALIAEATARFRQAIPSAFYPAVVCEQGYMMAQDHDGQLHRCPLAELSFDVIDNQQDARPPAGSPPPRHPLAPDQPPGKIVRCLGLQGGDHLLRMHDHVGDVLGLNVPPGPDAHFPHKGLEQVHGDRPLVASHRSLRRVKLGEQALGYARIVDPDLTP